MAIPEKEKSWNLKFRIELLRSEMVRVRLILWVLVIAVSAGTIFIYAFPYMTKVVFQNPKTLRREILCIGAFLIFEIFIFYRIKHHQQEKKTISSFLRYLNSFVEVSFVTLMTTVACVYEQDYQLLESASFLIYFIFLIMSPLRLNFRICLFTGIIAAIQYVSLSMWVLANYLPAENSGEIISFPGLHIMKGVFLIAGGLIAGFVAQQLHIRIKGLFMVEKEKNSIRMLFGQQVSPQVMSALTEGKRKMVGANLKVTVMFLDIRDFTPFAESCTPDEIVNFQNAIFGPFIEIVHQYNGIVNQILGDGFMATFGAPVASETHPDEAIKAGVDILKRVEILIKQKRIPPTKIGIGLHTGKVIAGNIGNNIRQQYSIIGTTVITAARIEQLNKTYKTEFLVSKSTFDLLNEPAIKNQFKHIDTTELKGMEDEVNIYSYEETQKAIQNKPA